MRNFLLLLLIAGASAQAADTLVACGHTGCATSTNGGVSFTVQASSTAVFGANYVWAVAYDAATGLFVAGDNVGHMGSSPDGVTWTTRTSSFGSSNIYSIASDGAGHWVAVGDASKIATSSNGTGWTQVANSFGATDSLHSVMWDGTQFIAAGWTSASVPKIATSPIGAANTWTQRSIAGTNTTVNRFVFGGGVYLLMASGTNGAYRYWRTTDPTNWGSAITLNFMSPGEIIGGTYHGTTFVLCGNSSQTVAQSTDGGLNWNQRTVTGMTGSCYAGAWSNGLWIVGGDQGATYGSGTSTDSVNWTGRGLPMGGTNQTFAFAVKPDATIVQRRRLLTITSH